MQIVIIHYHPRDMLPGSVPHVNRIAREFAEAKHGTIIVAPPGIDFEVLQLEGDEVDVVKIQQDGKKATVYKEHTAKKINHPGQIAKEEGAAVVGEDANYEDNIRIGDVALYGNLNITVERIEDGYIHGVDTVGSTMMIPVSEVTKWQRAVVPPTE